MQKSKVKIRHLILSVFVLISQAIAGQVGTIEPSFVQHPPAINVAGELYSGILQSDTYLNPEWTEGDMLLETGEKISNVYLRYNGLTDELFWREPVADKIIKVDKESVKGFHFNDFRGDTTVYFRRMKIKKDYVSDSTLCFLQEIDFINIRLFIYHSKFFLKRETYSVSGKTSIRDVYIEQPIYFIQTGSQLAVFRKITRKILCAVYPEKQVMIREYFGKSASGRTGTLFEIISFLQFFDTAFN